MRKGTREGANSGYNWTIAIRLAPLVFCLLFAFLLVPSSLTMIAVGNSAPSSSYTVNVRCIQVVQVRCHSALLLIRGVKTTKPSAHPYFGDIVVRRPGVEEIQGIPKTRVLTSIWLGNRAAAGHARAAEHRRVQAE
jgi:hypothetical protein